jgi:5-methylcytosine-specific restriction endonuclease McrA
LHHHAGDGAGGKDGGVIYARLPYPHKSWAEYLRTGIYRKPIDPVMDAVYRDKYEEHNALRYRPLGPNDSDVFVVRYRLHWSVTAKKPEYGNFSFRLCDKKTGRRPLVAFARFGEFGFDPFAGTCDRAKVFSFEPNREKIDEAMHLASRQYFSTLWEIYRQWSQYRPRLIISQHDRRYRYDQYLRSQQWDLIRGQVRAKYKDTCQECFKAGKVEIHHKTYERIGAEHIDDLVALCRSCHKALHAGEIVLRDQAQEVAA